MTNSPNSGSIIQAENKTHASNKPTNVNWKWVKSIFIFYRTFQWFCKIVRNIIQGSGCDLCGHTRHRNRKHICSVGGAGRYAYKHSAKSAYKQTITPARAAHLWGWLSRGISGDNVNIPTPSDLSSLRASLTSPDVSNVSLTAAPGHWAVWPAGNVVTQIKCPGWPHTSTGWSDSADCQKKGSRWIHKDEDTETPSWIFRF